MKWRADATLAALAAVLLLAACGPAATPGTGRTPEAVVKKAAFVPTAVLAKPVKFVPRYEATGYASWYGDELRGRPTASGEAFDPDGLTLAHRTLPLSSYVEVTALDTGRRIVARVNDRGPFSNDRLVDLSHGAARRLGISGDGHARVRIRRVHAGEARAMPASALPGPARPASRPAPEGVPRYVQVAAFASRERARAMAGRIGARADRAGAVYRVRFGPFLDEAGAKQALRDVAAKGYPEAQILPDSAP